MNRLLPALLSLSLLIPVVLTSHTRDRSTLLDGLEETSVSALADTTELPEPIAPVDTVLETSTVTFSWSFTRDSSYIVEIRGSQYYNIIEVSRYEVIAEVDTGTYDWRVRGLEAGVEGEPSAWATFRVREPLPMLTPLSPIDDTLTAGEIEFIWTGEWSGESEWRITGDSVRTVVTADTMLVETLDSGSYSWQVRATEDGAGGAWSEPAALTIVPVADLPVVTPLAPLNRTVGTGLIRLVWISDWRKSFVIEMRGDTTFTESVAAYKLEVQLDNEGTYEWRIRAIEGADLGPWSAWWSFSTSDDITGVEEMRDVRLLDLH